MQDETPESGPDLSRRKFFKRAGAAVVVGASALSGGAVLGELNKVSDTSGLPGSKEHSFRIGRNAGAFIGGVAAGALLFDRAQDAQSAEDYAKWQDENYAIVKKLGEKDHILKGAPTESRANEGEPQVALLTSYATDILRVHNHGIALLLLGEPFVHGGTEYTYVARLKDLMEDKDMVQEKHGLNYGISEQHQDVLDSIADVEIPPKQHQFYLQKVCKATERTPCRF